MEYGSESGGVWNMALRVYRGFFRKKFQGGKLMFQEIEGGGA